MKPALLMNNEQHFHVHTEWATHSPAREQKEVRFPARARAYSLSDSFRYPRRRNVEVYANPDAAAGIRRRITALADGWIAATAHLSRVSAYRRHPNFSRLLAIGNGVGEFAIDRIRAGDIQYHWLVLLKSIFQVDPTRPEHIGKASLQSADWVKWFEEAQKA